jgi:dTDP-4-dehydrorhamnose reductase
VGKLKILILGAYSNFGIILSKYLKKKNYIIYKSGRGNQSQIKINKLDNIPKIIKEKKPDVVINLIGETDVDFCEKYKKKAYNANVKILD